MNIQDRRRAADLIDAEFNSRISAARKTVTKADIEQRKSELIKKHKLTPLVSKLNTNRKIVDATEKALSETCSALYPDYAEKRYRGGCDCHKSYEEILTEAATAELNADGDDVAKLRQECRKLLAKIEVASSVDDIQAVMKAAKLI